MSAKSIRGKASQREQRKRMQDKMGMKRMMESKYEADIPPMNTEESKCQNCGFKARYKFVRCPECDTVQK